MLLLVSNILRDIKIEDIDTVVKLKGQMDNLKEIIKDIEDDSNVEVKVVKPFKYSYGEITLCTLSDDCKTAVIEQLKMELNEIECEIKKL